MAPAKVLHAMPAQRKPEIEPWQLVARPPFRSKKFSNGYLIGSILGSFCDMETASWCFFNIKKPTAFGFLVAATQCQGSGVDAQVKRTRFSEPGAVGAFCWKTCDFGLCSFLIKGGSS